MHKLYDLKTMLCEELEAYGGKNKLDASALDVVDKLAHAIKNIEKIIEAKEESGYSGYSGESYEGGGSMASYRGGSYARGGGGGGSSRAGQSYARGGRGGGQRRDSMGRYSREGGYSRDEGEFMEELRELMADAPNDHIRQKMQSIIGM